MNLGQVAWMITPFPFSNQIAHVGSKHESFIYCPCLRILPHEKKRRCRMWTGRERSINPWYTRRNEVTLATFQANEHERFTARMNWYGTLFFTLSPPALRSDGKLEPDTNWKSIECDECIGWFGRSPLPPPCPSPTGNRGILISSSLRLVSVFVAAGKYTEKLSIRPEISLCRTKCGGGI